MTIFPLSWRPARRGTVFMFVASLTLLATAGAADDNLSETVRRNETGQQQIQSQAKEFVAQLKGMSAEFERNGLAGDSVKMLDLLANAVGTMSDQDMARIINQLRQARTLNDKNAVLQQVTAAFVDQKKLTTDMKGWLARYQKDQVTADVAATLAKLAERQNTNFQSGVDVAQWSSVKKPGGKKEDPAENADALKAAVDMQSAEQTALRDEAKMAADRLANAARDKTDPAQSARAQAALDRLKALNATLDQAADDLKNGHLFKAVVSEKSARDALRQLARDLTPLKQNDTDALRQAERDVSEMVTQQKEMIAQTQKQMDSPPDFEHWLQQGLTEPKGEAHRILDKKGLLGKTVDELKGDKTAEDAFNAHHQQLVRQSNQELASLENKANDLVNKGDQVGQDLQKDAPQAAAAVKAAQDKMQAARADLDEKSATAALQNQQASLAQMEQAQKQIQAKLAAEDASRNADRPTQLQALKKQTGELAAQQNTASQQQALQPQAGANNAAQESQLRKQAQDLQNKAAQAQSPAAAQSLQNAANQMEKAANALNQPNGQPQAQAAEAQAQAELAKADAQLGKDLAQTAAAQQELKQADQALAALEKVIAGQTKVQADTTLLSSAPPAAKDPKDPKGAKGARKPAAPSVTELASQQATLKTDTGAIIPMLNTADLKPAAAPLTAAQDQMEFAHGALARTETLAALGSERSAITDLLQAKELLNAKKAELQQQTNPQTAEQQQQQAAQTAAQQISQAQQQAQQAQQQLAQQQQQQAGQPQASQPQAGQPQASQPQAGQPQAGQPQAGQPQAGQPQAGQPQAGQPQAGQPQAGQPPAGGQAQQSLNNAANLSGQAAASDPGSMAPGMAQNLQQAQQDLNAAAAADAQGNAAQAQALTQQALDALAQAQAQAAAAQAGLAQASDQNGAPQPGGQQPGGQQPGGQQQGGPQQGAKGGKPQAGKPGQQPGQQSGPATADAQGTGDRDANNIGEGGIEKGSRDAGKRGSAYANLPARDRAALQQSQSEKYPQEYGSMIEQYMQNLADESGGR